MLESNLSPSQAELSNASHLSDSLERLRLTTRVSQAEWLDLLGLHWSDYQSVKSGSRKLHRDALDRLSERFQFAPNEFLQNKLNYRELAIKSEPRLSSLPSRYSRAAYGRRRSSINSVDYIEKMGGWRLRHDLLEALEVPESQLADPFSSISVLFMTDVCAYLNRRQFDDKAMFEMGAATYEATRKTLVGKLFSDVPSVKELFDHFFSDFMKLFEENCFYKLVRITQSQGVLEVRSNSAVTAQLKIKAIGNEHLCSFKAGMIACIPQYLGRPRALVKETKCVHRGDSHCRFEFQFTDLLSDATPLS